MKTFECATVQDLEAAFASMSPDSLFRGQDKEYRRPDGQPSIPSSFERHGCEPPRMLKWYHYSIAILERFVKSFPGGTDMATDQAILQHYGWRSFFVDATSSTTVASWFAAHKYNSSRFIELIEDCWEDGLYVVRERAWFEPADGQGCVYAISRRALRTHGLTAVDLAEISTATGRTRFVAQSGFMVPTKVGGLPPECITAKVLAPSGVFAQYASAHSTSHLFPDANEDPVFAALLRIPWVKLNKNETSGLEFFTRGLPLPEYSVAAIRRGPPSMIFYRRFWAGEIWGHKGTPPPTVFLVNETLFYGDSAGTRTFPYVTALLREKRWIIVEIDGLIHYTDGHNDKGVLIETLNNGEIFLTALAVKQSGARPTYKGFTPGWYYRTDDDGRWERIEHPKQCDCGNERHHQHHLVVVEHLEAALARGEFKMVAEHTFAASGVIATSDPVILQLKGLGILDEEPLSTTE